MATDPLVEDLQSWRVGDAKRAILAFVGDVTASGSAGFVPPAARIAVFDNDGTLEWTVVSMRRDWATVFGR